MIAATALIADDEPLLRESLSRALTQLWPSLEIVATARNGREAVELFEIHTPDIVFLDVHMPGVNGVEAARQIGRRAQLVFVTAYEQYAVQAFEQGALDYVVKPVDPARLEDTVERLQERLRQQRAGRLPAGGSEGLGAMIEQLAQRLAQESQGAGTAGRSGTPAGGYLQWIRASVGSTLRLIPVDQILFMRSDEKYTLVVWDEGEALIRTPIRELIEQLDPQHFVQVHRSVVVNLHAISHVTRGPNETADLHLKKRSEILPVSRSYLRLFRQM